MIVNARLAVLAISGIFCATTPVHAQVDRGAGLFRERCAACHSVDVRQASPGIGPNLATIANRRAGSQARFQYSSALRGAKIVWSRDNLSRFLAGPAKFLPGSRMPTSIGNEKDRAYIVDYLMTLRGQ
jgi:cytochrome c